MKELKKRGIQTQVHYIPIYHQPYYQKKFNTRMRDYLNAEVYYEKCLSIPLFPAMNDNDVNTVIEEIKNLVRNN